MKHQVTNDTKVEKSWIEKLLDRTVELNDRYSIQEIEALLQVEGFYIPQLFWEGNFKGRLDEQYKIELCMLLGGIQLSREDKKFKEDRNKACTPLTETE
ncbi:hypothetical protein [Nostoc sp.]|uniref:hypothetical protein n=1 Tax=Nostoc sp. TaxID=1180 RepID=UPI002FF0B6EF